jgi:hypothetical protein
LAWLEALGNGDGFDPIFPQKLNKFVPIWRSQAFQNRQNGDISWLESQKISIFCEMMN